MTSIKTVLQDAMEDIVKNDLREHIVVSLKNPSESYTLIHLEKLIFKDDEVHAFTKNGLVKIAYERISSYSKIPKLIDNEIRTDSKPGI